MKGFPVLNSQAKDRVTGMVGTVTGHFEALNAKRVQLEGMDNTGRPIEKWFDLDRVDPIADPVTSTDVIANQPIPAGGGSVTVDPDGRSEP